MEYNENNASIPLVLTYKGINKGYKTTPRGTGIILEQCGVSKDVILFNMCDLYNDAMFVLENPNKSYKEVLLDLLSNTYTIGRMQVSSKGDLAKHYNENIVYDAREVDEKLSEENKQKIYFEHLTKNIFTEDKSYAILSDETVYNSIFKNAYNYFFVCDFVLSQKTCMVFPFLFPETQITLFPKRIEHHKQ